MKKQISFTRLLVVISVVMASSVSATESLPDPTRPLSPAQTLVDDAIPVTTTDWRLQMIRALNGRYVARVNGMTVTEGDSIAGVTVNRITARVVELDQDGTVFTLSLVPESFKTERKQK